MQPLQHLSARPTLTVDPWGFRLYDPVSHTYVGRPGPFGRERLIYALPNGAGPRLLRRHRVVSDPWGFALCDPTDGSLVGTPGVIVERMLDATATKDTRRFG
ncbi:MAG: hypothetical protein J2P16_01145 [Mycobacterium sp.]|nr:hypothetical protein [Mycobacterium sp.]